MSERNARLHALERNIDRYEELLKSNLSDLEMRFIERRLSEERFALAIEQSMSPSRKQGDPPDAR
jgi:hypothetical protein